MTNGKRILMAWRALSIKQQEALSAEAVAKLAPELRKILLLAEGNGMSLHLVALRTLNTTPQVQRMLEEARQQVYEHIKTQLERGPNNGGLLN